MVHDDAGAVVNPSLRNYRIPAFADVPPSEVHFAETHDRIGPLGAKSQGECAINPVAPAIANALADATGVRFAHLPLTPDRIFADLGAPPESTPTGCRSDPGITIVTQTRVRADATDGFARFQATISAAIAEQPGFIEQSVLPPNPPVQADWVILQRFTTADHAVAWLRSERRLALLAEAQPLLVGADDVHLVRDAAAGALPAPVSAVITTRIKPGREAEFRRWEHRIAAAQARFPGFQGYRFEPPIPGVQEDWLAILRFETDAALQGWMNSPERQSLLREAEDFTERVHARIVRAGFAQWFAPQPGTRNAAGLEAEHGRPAAALPRGVPVRPLGADAAADARGWAAVLAGAVRRQRRERPAAELAGPLDQSFVRLVARTRPPASPRRCRRRDADTRPLRCLPAGVLVGLRRRLETLCAWSAGGWMPRANRD